MDIDYEELQNFKISQSDEEEDNAEFPMIYPNLLGLNLEDNGSVSNGSVLYSFVKFYEICSQLNEGQQHLFNFLMNYALHCKLAE